MPVVPLQSHHNRSGRRPGQFSRSLTLLFPELLVTMDRCKEFLGKSDCLFNWELSEIDVNHTMPMVVKLREKMEEKDEIDDEISVNKWPYKLTYGYELFSEDPVEAERAVDEAIQEIETSTEHLNVKYRVPFLHIALSTKACLIFKCGENRLKETENLFDTIKPVLDMSDEEVSALLAMKAQIFRYYGPDGTNKSLSWLREAVRKNPKEVEWKISLVTTFNRKRHFFKGVDTQLEDIEEPVNILKEVLCCTDLTVKQDATCKYYLAVAYHDYTMGKKSSPAVEDYRRQVLNLCKSFCDKTDHPQYVMFAAERFAQSRGPEKYKGMEIIEKLIKKFPTHVGIHTTACKILKRQKDFARAAKHARIALDLGGYGAAWLWLECKTRMGHQIDAEEYFNNLLSQFQDMFKKQTHLNASYYYFFSRRDPVKGAHHFEQVLIEDPNFDFLLKPSFSPYARQKFIPMEIAYNQVVLALRSHHSRDDELTLNSAKRKIEEVSDFQNFCTSRNLVEEALKESRPQNHYRPGRRYY